MLPDSAAVIVASAFFNPVILLFLSGFVMSAVLAKFGISTRLAWALLAKAGTNPRKVLGVLMFACMVASSVLSNVPAALLGTSLAATTFPGAEHTSWPKTALLGIAFACNIGGMASPIASPQNVVAVTVLAAGTDGRVRLSFPQWLAVAVPFCFLATAMVWGLLVFREGANFPKAVAGPWTVPDADNDDDDDDDDDDDLVGLLNDPGSSTDPDTDTDDATFAPGAAAIVVYNPGFNLPVYEDEMNKPSGDGSDIDGCTRTDVPHNGGNNDGVLPHPPPVDDRNTVSATISNPPADASADHETVAAGGTAAVKPTLTDDVIISLTVITTVVLWVLFDQVQFIFGNIGIVGLFPIILFGSVGYITKEEFNSLSWDTLMLLGGGLSLGVCVDSSGLLTVIGDAMAQMLDGTSTYVVLLGFSALIAVLANFISSTVAAVLLMPVVVHVGDAIGHPEMLVLLSAFMTSGAMGLPVSSFPNANSFAQRHAGSGTSILTNADYSKSGFVICGLIYVLLNSLGYGLCLAMF